MRFYKTPFSGAYWRNAFSELKSTRMLVLAAVLVAVRVSLKSITIPVGENLFISIEFFVNAVGGMIYGPVLAFLSGIASDLLGCLLFPKGPFFWPFTLIEAAGACIYALFLYRAKLGAIRIFLLKLTINVFVNILFTSLALSSMLGKAVNLLILPRIAKNFLIFPLEAILLVSFISIMIPAARRCGYSVGEQQGLKITKRNIVWLAVMLVIAAAAILAYYFYFI